MNSTNHSASRSALLAGAALLALPAVAQDAASWKSADVEVTGHVLEPQQLEPTAERLAGLSLPTASPSTYSPATSSTHV